MPSIKDFESKKKTEKKSGTEEAADSTAPPPQRAQRRPGRDTTEAAAAAAPVESLDEVKVVDVETGVTMNETAMNENNGSPTATEDLGAAQEQKSENHVEIKFPGSEILRAKFSKPFEVAESIATDWLHDGKFEGLPLGHPLAQYFAAKGLQKAKQVEKKVLESPVTEKVAMQALQAGLKAQEIISQVRAKVKK